jgi:hypothetical protein
MLTKDDVRKFVELRARYYKGEPWDEVGKAAYDLVLLSEDSNFDYVGEFCEHMIRILRAAEKELEKKAVDIKRLSFKSFRHMVEEELMYWSYYVTRHKNLPSSSVADALVYGETMGFIKRYDSPDWEVFEGSDEPGELDMHLYRKLIIGEYGKPEDITLFSVQSADFVRSWNVSVIPMNVYFTNQRWVEVGYWHPNTEDVLVKVTLPIDAVVNTAEHEYMTIREVKPEEFKIGYL